MLPFLKKAVRLLLAPAKLWARVKRKVYLTCYDRLRFTGRKVILGDTNRIFFGPGWETVDCVGETDHRIELSSPALCLPFRDESVEVVYSSHLIEHLDGEADKRLFREIVRILKPGGLLRLCCPDMDYFIDSYLTDEKRAFFTDEYGVGTGRTLYDEVAMCVERFSLDPRLLETHQLLINIFCGYSDKPNDAPIFDRQSVERNVRTMDKEEFVRWSCSHCDRSRPGGHINGFNAEKLIRFLQELPFSYVYRSAYRESALRELNENPRIDLELRRNVSLYVEAVK